MTEVAHETDDRRPSHGVLPVAGLLLVLAHAACAPANPESVHAAGVPGFWPGLWHGLTSPVTFVISLVNDEVGIYAVRNSASWYDAGFMLGVSVALGGAARGGGAAAGPRRARRDGHAGQARWAPWGSNPRPAD